MSLYTVAAATESFEIVASSKREAVALVRSYLGSAARGVALVATRS